MKVDTEALKSLEGLAPIDQAVGLMKLGEVVVSGSALEQLNSNQQFARAFKDKVYVPILEKGIDRDSGNVNVDKAQVAEEVNDVFDYWFGPSSGNKSLIDDRVKYLQSEAERNLGDEARKELGKVASSVNKAAGLSLQLKADLINEADGALRRTGAGVENAITYDGGPIEVQVFEDLQKEVNRLDDVLEKITQDNPIYDIYRIARDRLDEFVQEDCEKGWAPDWKDRWGRVETELSALQKNKVFSM